MFTDILITALFQVFQVLATRKRVSNKMDVNVYIPISAAAQGPLAQPRRPAGPRGQRSHDATPARIRTYVRACMHTCMRTYVRNRV